MAPAVKFKKVNNSQFGIKKYYRQYCSIQLAGEDTSQGPSPVGVLTDRNQKAGTRLKFQFGSCF